MIYLSGFSFPSQQEEALFCLSEKRSCFDSFYPFGILGPRELPKLDFAPLTVLYGGNGSGKTTALNVIAEALGLERRSLYNRSNFFPDYLTFCRAEIQKPIPQGSAIITSDDVFDHMLDLRALNQGIDQGRDELFQQYWEDRRGDMSMLSLEDYQKFRRQVMAQRSSQSRYVRKLLANNVREGSNGESAFRYFTQRITEDKLYLLDEPENSLSPSLQMELARFLADSARFYGCQLLIATHSPFLLAMEQARIYDLDSLPVQIRPWTELENVRAYYEFFQSHRADFR
ncbi:MAG: AAA family ATPase [Firmicutes bacterium]|nr:AAA family ATPase [Bacillota bacterium]